MKSLYDFMNEKYQNEPNFHKFVEYFPNMYEFSKEVEVIPWCEDFADDDANPEVIDEIEFYQELHKNNMITEEELLKKFFEIYRKYGDNIAKTIGKAFIEEKQVSFREKHPTFYVALHELGHVYFKECDAIWNAMYEGGEDLVWNIILEKHPIDLEKLGYQNYEDLVRTFMEIRKLSYENKEKFEELLELTSKQIKEKYNIKVNENDEWLQYCLSLSPCKETTKLFAFASIMTYKSAELMLVHLMEAIRYDQSFITLWLDYFDNLIINFSLLRE